MELPERTGGWLDTTRPYGQALPRTLQQHEQLVQSERSLSLYLSVAIVMFRSISRSRHDLDYNAYLL